MTMNYCGRCGAANGTAARYCRQCGAELHNQAAFSSTSSPLNVEFSARNTSKDRQRETTPPAPVSAAPAQSASENSGQSTNAAPEKNQTADPDPKSISESLKRLRASGPLIVESVPDREAVARLWELGVDYIQCDLLAGYAGGLESAGPAGADSVGDQPLPAAETARTAHVAKH